jgi:mRNA interferase MazF
MVVSAVGDVVIIPFPFSDLSQSKVRPAVCIANVGKGDCILCQITSNPYGDPLALSLSNSDFGTGGLMVNSFARPGRLFTAHHGLVIKTIGTLKVSAIQNLLTSVALLFTYP